MSDSASDRDIANKDANYIRDIAHLLPAELTAFYISIKGIIPAAVNPQGTANNAADAVNSAASSVVNSNSIGVAAAAAKNAILGVNITTLSLLFAVAIALTVLFYFIMPTMLTITSPSQRLLYCITFIVWVLGIEVDRLGLLLQGEDLLGPTSTAVIRTLINLFVAIWSFALPYVFRIINPGPAAAPNASGG